MLCIKLKINLTLLLLAICMMGLTQTKPKKVSGTVTDAQTNLPLQSVSVTLADAKKVKGTSTDANGVFTIEISNSDSAKLLFSHLGYKSLIVDINGNNNLDVQMQPTATTMEDVVVIGYGTQKKQLLTGAVSKLENQNLDEMASSRLDNTLQGKIAGVTIQNVDNEAGAAPQIRVRGTSSINANADPLIIVDGNPIPDGLAFVNPYDVKSVEVLKDAASAAIYGSRGANGVILITTKEGSAGKPKYTLKAYQGFKQAYKLHPIMTFGEYVEKLYAEAAIRSDDPTVTKPNLVTDPEKASYIIEKDIVGFATDWQREALQNANISNIQLGISGGKSDIKYYISGNFQIDNGLMRFSQYEKTDLRAKVSGKLSKKMKFNISFTPTYAKRIKPASNFTDYYRFYSFLPVKHNTFSAQFVHQNPQWENILPGDWAQARHFANLMYSGMMPDGTIFTSTSVVNPWSTKNNSPLSIAARTNIYTEYYRMLGSAGLTYDILPGLSFETSIKGYYRQTSDNTFTQTSAKNDGEVNTAVVGSEQYINLLWENMLNYTKQFGKNHNLHVLLGYTAEKTTIKSSTISGENFPTEDFKTLNQAGQINQADTRTLEEQIGLVSYLGRVMYNFKEKYLFATSFRTDGSSYFARGNKFGLFPAVSLGWIASNEPFMKSSKWISNLKLRASYGATGNNRILSFAYQNLLNPANYDLGGGNGSVVLGLAPNGSILANPNITWERTFETNVGLDMAVLDNRLSFSIDYYNSKTDRLLLQQATLAFTGSQQFWNNAGSVRNKGIELTINTSNIKSRKLTWNTSFNISANRNLLISLGGVPFLNNFGERNEVYTSRVGQPSVQFYGYKTDGIWISQEEIDVAVAKGATSNISKYFTPGGLKVVDITGDGRIDASDRVPLGNPFPDFTWGLTNTLSYAGFDLAVLIQGSQGGKLINGDAFYNETKKLNRKFNSDNRWLSAAHPGDGKTPYFTNGMDWMLTDYVVEDASYAALRNVILGYTLPSKMTNKIKLSGLRVYASADNLLYLTGKSYRGINPEARSTSSPYNSPLIDGYQRGAFPIARIFTAGIELNF